MPVDTSMYGSAPQPQNPLALLSGVAGLQGQMLQNKLLGTEMGARQAVGEAIQGATDAEGTFDPNAFAHTVAGDPRAAFEAEAATRFAQEQRQAQLVTAQSRLASFNSTIAGLLEKPNVAPKDVTAAAADLVNGGIVDAKMVAGQLASMPSDPTQLPEWLKQHLIRGLQAQGQIEAMFGTPQPVNTGGETQFVRTPALGPTPAPLKNTMSPGEAASPVAGPVTPEGAPTQMTKGQFASIGGPVKVGLSPQEAAAQTTTGQGVAADAQAFEHGARGVADMRAALANMSGDIKSLETGPGSQARNSVMAAINSFMGTGFDANKVATQEGFDKLAAQVMARQREQLGLNATNAQVDIMSHASPGSQLSQLGNKNMLALIKGNNDALDAENQAWQRWKASGRGAETFHDFTTTFNKHVDPLVFQMQYMSADQKGKLVDAMTPAEKERLAQSLAFARHNGLIK